MLTMNAGVRSVTKRSPLSDPRQSSLSASCANPLFESVAIG